MKTKKEISDFYDGFIENQKKISYNERHFFLYNKLKKLGLEGKSNVLEIGCGIGVMSSLIAKTVKYGKIFSLDISPKSIEIAKKLNIKNAEFIISDAAEFNYKKIHFDFITLFDVLEHIPIAQHEQVFQNIASHMTEKTILFINIPNPPHLEYIIKNYPERLQIIDQPLPANIILNNAYSNSLELFSFQTYSLWVQNDYQMMLFYKKTPFIEKFIKESKAKKISNRIVNHFK
jgi:trans-aconitate 2-methyltransferase